MNNYEDDEEPQEATEEEIEEYNRKMMEKRAKKYFDSLGDDEFVETETITTTEKVTEKVIEKVVEKTTTKSKDKKERILPDGQKDLEGKDASNINFGDLVTRNIMKTTHNMLKTHLILFPSFGFKNEISGMILYGPNGTGKTEFCSKLMTLNEYSRHCDFETVDIYHLIDSKMGETSKKVADKFKEWTGTYKKKNRIQVKIIDEGEMIFLQKKDKGSKAYSELSNSMLKHTGKFNGVFIILITNDLDMLNKGAISRFERIYWPPLNSLERTDFMKNKFEKSEIKVDMKNFDKIVPYLNNMQFGDIRTHNKLMSHIKSWYVQNRKKDDLVDIEELIPVVIEFLERMNKEDEEMGNAENKEIKNYTDIDIEKVIDYLVEHADKKHVDQYVKLRDDYKQFGLRGNQLQGYVIPAYETLRKENKLKIGDLK